MKIGPLEFYWNPGPNKVAAEVRDYLEDAPEVRRGIARMARAEVKDYLGELSESMEMPFRDPASFLAYIRAAVATVGAEELKRRIFDTDESRGNGDSPQCGNDYRDYGLCYLPRGHEGEHEDKWFRSWAAELGRMPETADTDESRAQAERNLRLVDDALKGHMPLEDDTVWDQILNDEIPGNIVRGDQ